MIYPLYEYPSKMILTKRKVKGFRSVLEYPFPIQVGAYESREEAERGIEQEAQDRGFNAVEQLAIRHKSYHGDHWYTAVGTPALVIRDSTTNDKSKSECSEVNVRARMVKAKLIMNEESHYIRKMKFWWKAILLTCILLPVSGSVIQFIALPELKWTFFLPVGTILLANFLKDGVQREFVAKQDARASKLNDLVLQRRLIEDTSIPPSA